MKVIERIEERYGGRGVAIAPGGWCCCCCCHCWCWVSLEGCREEELESAGKL